MLQRMNEDILKNSFWALTAKAAVATLETETDGLSEAEAVLRIKRFGRNIIEERNRRAALHIILNQFKSPLIFILVIAGGVTFMVRDYKDAVVIFAAVIVNTLLGFYQENKAESALQKLKTYILERVRVVRSGREYGIDVRELVPGDVLRLYSGDRVPADARVIYSNDLLVDQSILTGESMAVHKYSEPVSMSAVLSDRSSMVFAGTLVTQGVGTAVVTATDQHTEIGKIATLVGESEEEGTPLQRSIRTFAARATLVLGSLSALVFILGIYLGHSVFEIFLLSVAIAVAAVPEGLPISLTVILSVGVERLAKKNGVVRKLLAAETLGNTSVILTDKTGTLTEARMSLSKVIIFDKKFNENDILRLSLMNVNVLIENPEDAPSAWRLDGKPLEVALVKSAAERGILLGEVRKDFQVISGLPFNSANKFSAMRVFMRRKHRTIFLGAPEILLERDTKEKKESGEILRTIAELANSGERILGLAEARDEGATEPSLEKLEKLRNLSLLGIITFHDPLRPTARQAFDEVTAAGVRTVIVSGDHAGTVQSIAREIGLEIDRESIIDGAELSGMSFDELKVRLPLVKMFSRVTPEDKLKIVKAYQELGEVVAMTGDGVNDAPSVKRADIGIAMGTATDVTKDVADLIILDDNFETIVAAINEGRAMLENIRKVVVYLLSNALDGLLLIAGALILDLPLPLSALQILWINFFSDSFPAVALAFEKDIDGPGNRPKRIPKNLLDKEMQFLVIIIGTLTSLLLVILYYLLLYFNFPIDFVKTFIFASVGTYSLFLIFAVKSLTKSIWSYNIFSNRYLVWSVLFGFLLMGLAVYFPPLQRVLGTVPLSYNWVAAVIAIGVLNIFAIEFGKFIYRRNRI